MKKFVKILWCLLLTFFVFQWLTPSEVSATEENFWIDMNTNCLLHGTCHFSVYDATKIRKESRASWEETSVLTFFQDIVYWATLFIWTVVAAWIILSWILLILGWADSSLKSKAMSGLKYAIIWWVVVTLSLVIIRLVQFLAKGGGS